MVWLLLLVVVVLLYLAARGTFAPASPESPDEVSGVATERGARAAAAGIIGGIGRRLVAVAEGMREDVEDVRAEWRDRGTDAKSNPTSQPRSAPLSNEDGSGTPS